jgi:hypothetical protein
MNLYLLLAFALGAITGTAEARVVRASVILSRETGEGSQVAKKETLRCAQGDGFARSAFRRRVIRAAIRFEAPLTGSATPRAPAVV